MVKKKEIKKEARAINREWKNIIFNLIFAALNLTFVTIFYKNVLLTFILISLVTITGLIKWKSWGTFAIFIFVAIFGPVAEMIAIYFGAWHYANFNFINIPVWLFVLWGDAAAFIYQTALEFRKLGLGND